MELYMKLKPHVLTQTQLRENKYPLKDQTKANGVYVVSGEPPAIKNDYSTPFRYCARCDAKFEVDITGYPLLVEACRYHRKSYGPVNSVGQTYRCCSSSGDGCKFARSHVIDGADHESYSKGYVHLKPKPYHLEFPGIYAVDCEMCYTTAGYELTKVSVIDHNLKCVYETLVKPRGRILDPNTKFSGIEECDIMNTTTRLEDVQEHLLTLFYGETILIGHNLDHDLKALKILPGMVVDTSVMYPHRFGLPFRNSLNWLVTNKLHYSKENRANKCREDAIACMKLALKKTEVTSASPSVSFWYE